MVSNAQICNNVRLRQLACLQKTEHTQKTKQNKVKRKRSSIEIHKRRRRGKEKKKGIKCVRDCWYVRTSVRHSWSVEYKLYHDCTY
jgi:hypothetical protein